MLIREALTMKTPEQNEPPATPAEELPAPRRPRRPEDFDAFYASTPPWDIGRPQPVFLSLGKGGPLWGRGQGGGWGTGGPPSMAPGQGRGGAGHRLGPARIPFCQ